MAALVAGCATSSSDKQDSQATSADVAGNHSSVSAARTAGVANAADVALLNRITWGATATSIRQLQQQGVDRFIEAQLLAANDDALPAAVQAHIAAMTISREPMSELVVALDTQRKQANDVGDVEEKKVARRAYQQALTRLGNEAASRALLRAVYSEHQLREQLTWFWMNHFNVFQGKANLRVMIGDFEERAIRPHVLGVIRRCFATSTMSATRQTASTRTMHASSWSFTRSASTAATRRRTCRSLHAC
jgi:uncharacterized protein (DUF1800 family)